MRSTQTTFVIDILGTPGLEYPKMFTASKSTLCNVLLQIIKKNEFQKFKYHTSVYNMPCNQ